ncbi:MAG: glycosyltransferase family 61 protein [Synergistaceae bacterium]|nr:glycosyltransferase family 61 protein [Synergistaceae bacterium]
MTRPDQTRPANYDFLYDKNYYGELLYQNHFIDKELGYRVIDNCCLSPKGINTQEGLNIQRKNHKKQTVIYIGSLSNGWGHFITNSMSMLWFLNSKEYHENFSDCNIVYLPAQGFTLKGNQKRMLEILGINLSKLEPVTELTSYDKVIVPDECFILNEGLNYFTQEYRELVNKTRDFALANIHPIKSQKVYFSYSRYRHNRSIGEDKLDKYFASKGYEIIYHPEKLTLDEQLNILIQCESFASTVGSCSHNIIFLRDNTEVILIPRTYFFNRWQAVCDQVHELNINYVDSSFSLFVGKLILGGPFLYFISSNLRKFFHDKNTESIVNVSDFKKYLRISFGYSMSRAIAYADNPDVYKYYSIVAPDYFSKLFNSSLLVRLKKWLKSINFIRSCIRHFKP